MGCQGLLYGGGEHATGCIHVVHMYNSIDYSDIIITVKFKYTRVTYAQKGLAHVHIRR